MDAGDLLPLGYAAIAAGFGYLATLVVRRYEVVRSMAVEIDNELRDAFNDALRDDMEPLDQLNAVNEHLIRAELRTGGLPVRDRERVDGQLRVAHEVLMHLFSLTDDPRVIPEVHLQAAISAVREVVGPLLLPPPLFRRTAGKPSRYPEPGRFATIMLRNESPQKALQEALAPYLEGLPEAFEDHYPPK